MSRHDIPALQPGLTVTVGWDNPLQTFFAQVSRNNATDDEHSVLLWVGAERLAVLYPQDLIIPLAPYAILTDNMIDQLRADRAANLGRGPTALQRHAQQFILNSQ